MSLIGKLGEKLKTTREAKGYSIREVSAQTHISPKFLDALEKEDYSVFPSETYTIGFLKTYAEFLGLNPQEILKIYQDLKIQVSQTPVEELTKISKISSISDYQPLFKYVGIIVVVFVALFVIYRISDFFISKRSFTNSSNETVSCQERELKKIQISKDTSFLSIIDLSNQYDVSYENTLKFNLCLLKIDSKNNRNTAEIEITYNNKKYTFNANELESRTLNNLIPELNLETLQPEINIKRISEENAEIEITVSEKVAITNQKIVIYLELLQDSYIEWEADGKNFPGTTLPKGENRIIEADTKIDLKIGNAGGVSIRYGNNPAKVVGPPGKIARIIYKKVADPYDPTKINIQEEVQLSQ